MGKSTVHGLVEEAARDAIQSAAELMPGKRTSMAGFLEEIGHKCESELARLKAEYPAGELPKCKLVLKLVPDTSGNQKK